jgi:hypothetical protein
MAENDDLSLVRKDNIEVKKQNEALQAAIRKMSEPAGPRHIRADDLSSGRARVDPRDIATGAVVVDFPEAEPVELKAGQISRSDPKLGEHLTEIAQGKLEVV